MSSDPLLGQISIFGFNFAPRGWAKCQGQLLPISSYTALFSLLGTTYGGDGRTTFALPDLRARTPVGLGQGPGLSNINWGERGGAELRQLVVTQLPSHNHPAGTLNLPVLNGLGDQSDPALGNVIASHPGAFAEDANTSVNNLSGNTGDAGGSQAFGIRDPFLGLNFCIAIQGVYPSRS